MKKNSFILLGFFAMISMACTISGVSIDLNRVEGSGTILKEERSVGDFSEVILSGMGNLFIVQGDENKIVIEAEDNLIPQLTTEVNGDRLTIGVEKGVNIFPTKEVNYYITLKELSSVQILGAGNAEADGMNVNNLELRLTGLGSMEFTNLTAEDLDIMISGAGDIELDGTTDTQKVNITGAGNYHAEDLRSRKAEVIVSGLGNSDLWVEEDLSVIISGGGNINYYGSPETDRTITGLGKLTSQGEHY